jgi:hypothetical protein
MVNLVIITNLFLSLSVLAEWLRNHLLPCPFKFFTGIDCPGCGFQRSVLAMIQGNFHESFRLYPPAIPLLLTFIYLMADKHFKLDNRHFTVKKTVYMITATIIMVSYVLKIWSLYQHYRASV